MKNLFIKNRLFPLKTTYCYERGKVQSFIFYTGSITTQIN